jgi:predicted phage tail protein
MKKTIYLYGELAKKFTDKLTVEADSIYKVISALRANFQGFEAYMLEYTPGFHVRTGDIYRSEDTIGEPLGNNDIHLIPATSGSSGKAGALFAIIIGIVLLFVPGAQGLGAYAITGGITGAAATIITSFAMGLIFAGISALLFAPPKSDGPNENGDNKPNSYFNGPVNTIAQGHPVPVGYGELIIGSAVISAGLESVNT